VIGGLLVALGAVLGVVAFTVADWFDGGDTSRFGTVQDDLELLQQAHAASGFAVAYFGWLAPLLLALAVVAGALANVFRSGLLGAAGAVLGAAGVASTFLGIKLVGPSAAARAQGAPTGYGGYLAHTNVGFYLAVAGFAVIASGAAVAACRAYLGPGKRLP
jgi:hypothetical protein